MKTQTSLIIHQPEADIQANIESLRVGTKLLADFIECLAAFQSKTGIVIVDLAETFSATEFLSRCREVIPSRVEVTGRTYLPESDFERDHREFSLWAKNQVADRMPTLGGLPVSRELVLQHVQLPDETTELIRQFRDVFALHPTSRMRRFQSFVFLEFIRIDGGKVSVTPGAEDAIRERLTSYANEHQSKAWDALQKAIKNIADAKKELDAVENKFGLRIPERDALERVAIRPDVLMSLR